MTDLESAVAEAASILDELFAAEDRA